MFNWDETMFYCFIIVVFNATILIIYHFKVDPNKDIERYYFKTNKYHYSIFKLAYFIILVSFIFSIRYIIFEGFSVAKKRFL